MRWDDRVFTGRHGRWHWIVVRGSQPDLEGLLVAHFAGARLGIPNSQSIPADSRCKAPVDCTRVGEVLFTPPLSRDVLTALGPLFSCCECDCYVYRELPASVPLIDCPTNYGNFNLADPRELAASFEPTWERDGLDGLLPIQDRFWSQIESASPTAYCAVEYDTVAVSTNQQFIEGVAQMARSEIG